MNVRASRFVAAVAAAFGLAALAAPVARAVPVELNVTSLRAIRPYAPVKDKPDDVSYLLVTGVAKGKELEPAKLPKDGTFQANKRKQAVDAKKPLPLWTGDLADGEFALLTITLFHGTGADAAKVKAFADKKAAGEKAVAARSAAKLASADEQAKLAEATLAAHKELIKNVRQLFPADKPEADHYGGQFTVVAWNNGGKIVNRLDPVGLTFGEHYGTKEKVYTKLKYTRQNVFVQDESGDWSEQQLLPLSDDDSAVRVKMLETVKVGPGNEASDYKVTDYLAELQVKADGKPVLWQLGGAEMGGTSDLHYYWAFAETKKEKAKK